MVNSFSLETPLTQNGFFVVSNKIFWMKLNAAIFASDEQSVDAPSFNSGSTHAQTAD
jgi:hypothetical protein